MIEIDQTMNLDYSIFSLGDSALTIDFGNVLDENTNKKVLLICQQLKNNWSPEVVDMVPAYSSLTIHYNVVSVLRNKSTGKTAFEEICEKLKNIILKMKVDPVDQQTTIVKVPVCYAQQYALDIEEIAYKKNIPVNEVIQLHTAKKYRVYMIGFLPGFAYMGEVDDRIAIPRKHKPRINIEAGSVGIAGKQTGIYPLNSPGGWQIIGKTPLQLFNKEKENPVLFAPGHEVEFFSISADEFQNYKSRNP